MATACATRHARKAARGPHLRPSPAGKDWFVNWADFPSVARAARRRLSSRTGSRKSGPGAYAYDVRVTASRDGGQSWSAPVVPHRDGTPDRARFRVDDALGRREMGLVWLDGRKTAALARGHARQAAMSLVHTTLDADGRLGPETALDPRVCDCCQTDAARRRRSDRRRVPRPLGRRKCGTCPSCASRAGAGRSRGRWPRDGWEIHGCPVNGPGHRRRGRPTSPWRGSRPADASRA